jgi:hypothetical protein
VRRAATLASILVLAAGCGDRRAPAPAAPLVAKTLHEWVAAFRAEDADALCARTFMAYDAGRSAARLREDCLATYGDGLRTLKGRPRIVRMGRIAIGGPMGHRGGISRTARVDVTVRYEGPAGPQTRPWHARLVLYRGRWRVLQGHH